MQIMALQGRPQADGIEPAKSVLDAGGPPFLIPFAYRVDAAPRSILASEPDCWTRTTLSRTSEPRIIVCRIDYAGAIYAPSVLSSCPKSILRYSLSRMRSRGNSDTYSKDTRTLERYRERMAGERRENKRVYLVSDTVAVGLNETGRWVCRRGLAELQGRTSPRANEGYADWRNNAGE